ncbi:MAG: phage tape measure protein [Herbinix sp.]|jgi:tape measure domain-containing protein|nr:phage tape measure protein [Herbinix sp.]
MPSLNALFRLYDKYSSTADKIIGKTDKATNKILNASGATDKFNSKLQATGASASNASNGLGKYIKVAAAVTSAIKGMEITDTYSNTQARLDLINDGLQTQAELQDKIFAAANRSKGAYSGMANAVSKMGLLASESFNSNDELIAFTELMQKSFKIGGASTSEQSSAVLQLTQAMAAGKLQGDEFRSIMENAPMLADAIAKFTGKSKGELKEMSADGAITADIIKGAMFTAADDINAKFAKMPFTFADVWNRIKNGGTKAFSKLMEKVNKLINTDKFMNAVDKFIGVLSLAADAAGWLVDTIVEGWDVIGPILALITGLYLITMIGQLWAMIPPLLAQGAAWLSIYWPILLIIGVIALAIVAARHFGASWEDIFGFVGGIVGVFATYFYNRFVMIWNAVAAFINFFGNVFNDPVASIKALFFDMSVTALGYIEKLAQGIEDVLNKIPGVNIDLTSGLEAYKNKLAAASEFVKSKADLKTYVQSKEFMDFSEGWTRGSDMGKNVLSSINDAFGGLTDLMSGANDKGTTFDPTIIQGIGNGGKVEVDMSEEDLKYLRDVAEKKFINKFSTATLAPNVTFNFGDIHEEADANKLKGTLEKMMREEIAVAAEGDY